MQGSQWSGSQRRGVQGSALALLRPRHSALPNSRSPDLPSVATRPRQALELFERMERMHLPRDAITYSATISALAKGKQWHAALQVCHTAAVRPVGSTAQALGLYSAVGARQLTC